ncbi:hypothetical protein D8M04_15410 [Oceanobacillus piezotolerans]|uniref:Uncharacterized protein n=1 Tax=Oceanobacillus piezotolerans TaxID=2448030 RepID=A0A498D3X0_9BACI|nr:hypothetical protein [Oceanobacillus piezotolerans]RLL42931.1 hypothetical protein D8M04_15410 [Oceanobacillus piezotolerans]
MDRSNNDLSLDKVNSVELFEKASNQSFIRESGNSDVDIRIELDTTPIAYAMLCSMLATNQMSHREFQFAVRKLEDLINKKNQIKDGNDMPKPVLFNDNKPRRRF